MIIFNSHLYFESNPFVICIDFNPTISQKPNPGYIREITNIEFIRANRFTWYGDGFGFSSQEIFPFAYNTILVPRLKKKRRIPY